MECMWISRDYAVSPFSNASLLPALIPHFSLQVKLMKYICKQLQCKQKVPETDRPEALDSYPRLRDWLRTINLRPELIHVCCLAVIPSALVKSNQCFIYLLLFCLFWEGKTNISSPRSCLSCRSSIQAFFRGNSPLLP